MTEEEIKKGEDSTPEKMDHEINADNFKSIIDNVIKEYQTKVDELQKARVEDAKKYADSVINGRTVTEKTGPQLAPAAEYKKAYFGLDSINTNDVTRWTALLNWRDAELKETGKDIFCLTKGNQQPSEEAKASAERTADVMKQMIEDSRYDEAMFKAIMDKRVVDPVIKKVR